MPVPERLLKKIKFLKCLGVVQVGFKQITHSAQAVEGLTRAAQEEAQSIPPQVQQLLSESS